MKQTLLCRLNKSRAAKLHCCHQADWNARHSTTRMNDSSRFDSMFAKPIPSFGPLCASSSSSSVHTWLLVTTSAAQDCSGSNASDKYRYGTTVFSSSSSIQKWHKNWTCLSQEQSLDGDYNHSCSMFAKWGLLDILQAACRTHFKLSPWVVAVVYTLCMWCTYSILFSSFELLLTTREVIWWLTAITVDSLLVARQTCSRSWKPVKPGD